MSNKIIKLHGCSGAGKTTVARAIMLASSAVTEVVPEGSTKPEAYACQLDGFAEPVIILGSYRNNCGGMDSFPSDAPTIIKAIEFYLQAGHVFFEGLLLSTYYGTVGKYMEQFGNDAIFAFMDTPILTCLERVTRRRDVQQTKTKFNPQNTIDKYNTIAHLKGKCTQNGRRVVEIKGDADPVGQIKSLLEDWS